MGGTCSGTEVWACKQGTCTANAGQTLSDRHQEELQRQMSWCSLLQTAQCCSGNTQNHQSDRAGIIRYFITQIPLS